MALVMELVRRKGFAVFVGFALGFIANELLSQGTQVAIPKDDCFREAAKNPTEVGVMLAVRICTNKFGELDKP